MIPLDELKQIWAETGLWRKYNFYDWLEDLFTLIKNNDKENEDNIKRKEKTNQKSIKKTPPLFLQDYSKRSE